MPLCSDEFLLRLIIRSVDTGATKRDSVGKVNFAPVVHSFAALGAGNTRARVTRSVLLAQMNFYWHHLKQLFFGGFAIGLHLTLILVLDFRMTQVSQIARRFE